MSQILTEVQKKLKAPPQLEEWMTSICGSVHCSKCGVCILGDDCESDQYETYTGQYQKLAIVSHFCGPPFKYDFNDPRTIKEQQAAAMQP